jgi:hypothetical protein
MRQRVNRWWVMGAGAVLGACGGGGRTGHEILVYPDGSTGARAECVNDEAECHGEASAACPYGYWVLSREDEQRYQAHTTPHGTHAVRYRALALNVRCAPRPY